MAVLGGESADSVRLRGEGADVAGSSIVSSSKSRGGKAWVGCEARGTCNGVLLGWGVWAWGGVDFQCLTLALAPNRYSWQLERSALSWLPLESSKAIESDDEVLGLSVDEMVGGPSLVFG